MSDHSAGFGVSLLALLKGAAGDDVDKTVNFVRSDSLESVDQGDKAISSFTSDMLASLPGGVVKKDDEYEELIERSQYLVKQDDVTDQGVDKREEEIAESMEDSFTLEDTSNQKWELSSQDKLNIAIQEHGKSNLDDLLDSDEEHVADTTAYYLDDVVIKGYAMVTTHRFMFIAFLPKQGLTNSNKEETILAGAGHFHRPGQCGRRRVWFELKKDRLVGYPSSQRLYEPFGSVRIIHIEHLANLIDGGKEVHLNIRGVPCWMLLDTHEAAIDWHRELTGLIWQSKHNVEVLKIAVPLLRIAQLSTSIFMDFSKAISLKVDQSKDGNDPLTRLKTLNISVHLPVSDAFVNPLQETWLQSQQWKKNHLNDLHRVPRAALDFQDNTDQEEIKEKSEHHQHHHHHQNTDKPVSQEKEFLIKEFALAGNPKDMHVFRADVVHGIPNGGYLILTTDYLCFYSRRVFKVNSGIRTKIPLGHIQDAQSSHAFRWHHYGLRLIVEAHSDVSFELHNRSERDKLMALVKEAVSKTSHDIDAIDAQLDEEETTAHGNPNSARARLTRLLEQDVQIPHHVLQKLRKPINVNMDKHIKLPPMRISCLTIGSRGDVQPYIALCKSLMEHGHHCIIVSHPEYKEWVNKNGVEFRPAGGDPGILMKLSVENKMFSTTFFKETLGKFRQWLDELLREIIEQCYDVDLIVESPSTFGGIHAAEALEIGYMRAFTMPWTKTSAYPQAFSVPSVDLGAGYNSLSYDLYEQVIWMASEGQVNRWRRNMLGLASTTLAKLDLDHVPFMYNFSPGVVPAPNDWSNLTTITGYWNLPSTSDTWQPPDDLEKFLERARQQDKKLAYIGFGSITIPNARKTMQMIFDAAHQSGVYCVISKGWSDRMEDTSNSASTQTPYTIPDNVYLVDSIPHDWLFPRIDIAFHHGGAGTTGASLSHKLVTLIHPFFGDQFFWANRVEKLGAGKRVTTLNAHDITQALSHAANDRMMKEKAAKVGEAIKSDRGVESARAFIYRHYKASKRKARRANHTMSTEGRSSSSSHKASKKEQQSHHPSAERQDSGLALVLVESPLSSNGGEHGQESPTSESPSKAETGGYSSKRAKQEDISRRLALLEKCKAEGKDSIFKVLDGVN